MQAAGQAGPKILFDLSRGKEASGVEIYAAGLETPGAIRRPEALPESDSGGETIQGAISDSVIARMRVPQRDSDYAIANRSYTSEEPSHLGEADDRSRTGLHGGLVVRLASSHE